MASLPNIVKWSEALPYLANLKETILRDVRSLLTVPGGAPFSIAREALCYVDHLGHALTGKSDVGGRFRDYMNDVMSRVDTAYRTRSNELYQMYRNGPVHEFEPKVLENKKGQLLQWFMYSGARSATVQLPDGRPVQVRHLRPLAHPDGRLFWLPVSTPCLVDDVAYSIEQFGQIGPEDERVTAWNRAARKLGSPRAFDFAP